jgi:hypothetical protein
MVVLQKMRNMEKRLKFHLCRGAELHRDVEGKVNASTYNFLFNFFPPTFWKPNFITLLNFDFVRLIKFSALFMSVS